MERVAFLIDDTGERIECLLNPESLEIRRLAGVRSRGVDGGRMVGAAAADDPLLLTGGGRTELVIDLLFDVALVESGNRPVDVRALTHRLWTLAENSTQRGGRARPPLVRLVWGKTWNVPGIVVAVAERFDAVDAAGIPQRSWLRLKLVRVVESVDDIPVTYAQGLADAGGGVDGSGAEAVQVTGDGAGAGATRMDLVATEASGDPYDWRSVAEHNRIDDPLAVPAGTVLSIPSPTAIDNGGQR